MREKIDSEVFTACFKLLYPILLFILILLVFRLRQQIFLGGELAKEKKGTDLLNPLRIVNKLQSIIASKLMWESIR